VSREPDEPDRPREPTASAVDAAFAQIVAGWDDPPPQWPAEDTDAGPQDPYDSAPTEEIPAAPPPAGDDEHFVPPEPPPLPRPRPATIGAMLLFAIGIVLLKAPHVIGFSDQYGLPLGLLSITGAIVWLVARLRQGPPTDSGWDDGAQV